MSLHVYTDKKFIPSGIDFINWGDTFFDINTSLSNDDLVRDILWHIDKAKFNNENSFVSRVPGIGALNKSCLSSGTKTLLNIISHPGICFNIESCGGNALEYVPRLTSGNIYWDLPVLNYAGDEVKCDIVLNGAVHYTDIYTFLDALASEDDSDEFDFE